MLAVARHLGLRPPTPAQSVYREDCTECFDSIDDPDGLDVCLQCFNGGCTGDRHHAKMHNIVWKHPLALNIRRTRKVVVRDEPPPKMSKLAIAAETEDDRYDTAVAVKCFECDTELDKTDPKLAPIVDGILKANTFSRKEEVKAWEQELVSCEHIRSLQQEAARTIASQDLGHCTLCELNENLWLCLQCGNLGCGRAQFGGVGGNSHGLAHATASGHGVAVKLGSITPEGHADVYCYTCDDERIDDQLGDHLAHWGIVLADRQKTEKSLTEMQIEQNLRWEFTMTTEDGKELRPLFGKGLTGLKNLGNSCYLASILQCLYDLPSFQKRYGAINQDMVGIRDPADDLETQLRKVGDGLLSGRYSKPDAEASASTGDDAVVPHQKGLEPAMLKHLVGRGHEEFSTMRQQDAFELLQHLIKLITRSKHATPADDPTAPFRFTLEQRLQCLSCKKVRYTSNEQDSIFIDVPLEKLPAGDGPDAADAGYKPVTLKDCLDRFTGEETVELTCAACGSKDGYTKRSLFKTLPDVFVVNARKMTLVNWVPIKVDVPVLVDDAAFPLDGYLSPGQQPGEELLPEDASTGGGAPAFVANPEAVAQLEGMGFPLVRCEKALYATGNGDANAAMEWLFGHMEDPDIDEPLVVGAGAGGGGGAGGATTADPEKIKMLGAMGFAEPQAKQALRETGGDVERAVEWLFSHPEATGEDDSAAAEAAGSSAERPPAGTSETPANYQLQSIVCHKGTSIHAGHYVAFIRKRLAEDSDKVSWVLFNDEKVVEVVDVEEMKKFAYIYFFKRV
ncbi:ubiquitin carboxyl-terminal hydrolase 5/13 [Sporothrix schenckii 1099-18]|uniref:Ubiquitin carboxyl-terminal hydrolase n=1 Tax=Sporothrix schenckii 1099-18 TaxID=1397361 RepID=A0A0F2MKG9_SPOSC|nr:ubiquitin carboxyl-terminal hydrolase 5/13 [Sporothrix schenckii 1099-18]KJR89549.1 ubiquitin carboxyl-terminal hydrolase 5/13 [Sporothrix schenckii 1099-18]